MAQSGALRQTLAMPALLPCPLLALGLVLSACATAQHELRLPPRAAGAVSGSELLLGLRGQSLAERERLVLHELSSGNLPAHLRRLVPVTTKATIAGRQRSATFWCTPDYLGVGADRDWFRMPLSPPLAQRLADDHDCLLPTRRMVDAIWQQAADKLPPAPFSPSVYNITAVDTFYLSHQKIESQRRQSQGSLIAGIKKDVVASALIASWPNRVVIYGWHYQNGRPIQPLSKVHTFPHVDYSHGIRLVSRHCLVDGQPRRVEEVLRDPQLHVLFSDEGPIQSWRYPASAQDSLPLRDAFPAAGPQLRAWRHKFKAPRMVPVSPRPPSGDAQVLQVMDPAGGTDSIRVDLGLVEDLVVQATLLCEHRPGLSQDGFERVGIFVRDNAAGAFDGTLSQAGACYALTWDSGDGRLRCLRVKGGQLSDLLPAPRRLPGTAWRRFRLEARGDELRYFVDGEELLRVRDASFVSGACGVGYHEFFRSNANARGTRVDAFWADAPGSLSFALRSDRPGELAFERRRGVPGDIYLTAVALQRGSYPHGWFYGLDPSLAELSFVVQSAHPWFVGRFDAAGRADILARSLPSGLRVHAVTLGVDPGLKLVRASAPRVVQLR